MKIELSYRIFSKRTGQVVKFGVGIFDSIDYFFVIMNLRYGYSTKYYDFCYIGTEVN